jgi:hypothetical protein
MIMLDRWVDVIVAALVGFTLLVLFTALAPAIPS